MGLPRTTASRRRRRKRRLSDVGRAVLAPVRGSRKPAGSRLLAAARPSWKLVGLAGLAGVAATGVAVARSRRTHVDLPPEELRERLHRRLTEVAPGTPATPADPACEPPSRQGCQQPPDPATRSPVE